MYLKDVINSIDPADLKQISQVEITNWSSAFYVMLHEKSNIEYFLEALESEKMKYELALESLKDDYKKTPKSHVNYRHLLKNNIEICNAKRNQIVHTIKLLHDCGVI